MKNIRTTLLLAIFSICTITSFAQSENDYLNEPDLNKPRLFDNLPSRISISIDEMNNLINVSAGRKSSLPVSSALQFEGEVVSTSSKYGNKIQSVVIRSTNFIGATLVISKVSQDDGSFAYSGRIISFQHGDLFELKSDDVGKYAFVKKNFYDLVNQ